MGASRSFEIKSKLGYPEHNANCSIPLQVETSSKVVNTSVCSSRPAAREMGLPNWTSDVLGGCGLRGTGRRGRARAGTSIGKPGVLIGRHAAREETEDAEDAGAGLEVTVANYKDKYHGETSASTVWS